MKPIYFEGIETLGFRQIDVINGFIKGTAFRLFKRARGNLVEGSDYFYLSDLSHGPLIRSLKDAGAIYMTTRHLVLITRAGYERMQTLGADLNLNG